MRGKVGEDGEPADPALMLASAKDGGLFNLLQHGVEFPFVQQQVERQEAGPKRVTLLCKLSGCKRSSQAAEDGSDPYARSAPIGCPARWLASVVQLRTKNVPTGCWEQAQAFANCQPKRPHPWHHVHVHHV